MSRLALAPIVAGTILAAGAVVACSPYLWPILTTARAVFRCCPHVESEGTEFDRFA